MGAHDTIQHLVKVYEAVVHIDSHLEDNPVVVRLLEVLFEPKAGLHLVRQLPKEGRHMLGLHFDALVAVCEVLPGTFERLEILLEDGERIDFVQIVLLELHDDDQDEEVEHDIADQHDENQEE